MTFASSLFARFRVGLVRLAFFGLLSLPLLSSAQVEAGLWKSKTKGLASQLPVFFPKPTSTSGSPELLVVPLLGPERLLLPGGKLRVWVGRSDGTALVNVSVTIRVPSSGNALVAGGSRVTEVTIQTDANGLTEVFLTSPDIPPASTGSGGDGGPAAEE